MQTNNPQLRQTLIVGTKRSLLLTLLSAAPYTAYWAITGNHPYPGKEDALFYISRLYDLMFYFVLYMVFNALFLDEAYYWKKFKAKWEDFFSLEPYDDTDFGILMSSLPLLLTLIALVFFGAGNSIFIYSMAGSLALYFLVYAGLRTHRASKDDSNMIVRWLAFDSSLVKQQKQDLAADKARSDVIKRRNELTGLYTNVLLDELTLETLTLQRYTYDAIELASMEQLDSFPSAGELRRELSSLQNSAQSVVEQYIFDTFGYHQGVAQEYGLIAAVP